MFFGSNNNRLLIRSKIPEPDVGAQNLYRIFYSAAIPNTQPAHQSPAKQHKYLNDKQTNTIFYFQGYSSVFFFFFLFFFFALQAEKILFLPLLQSACVPWPMLRSSGKNNRTQFGIFTRLIVHNRITIISE